MDLEISKYKIVVTARELSVIRKGLILVKEKGDKEADRLLADRLLDVDLD